MEYLELSLNATLADTPTWLSLAIGLGSNIFRLLDSLRALSGQAGCRLRALHLSDLFSPLPILELTRAIVRALPLLRVLSIRVDHPSQRDNPAAPGNAGLPSHIIGDEEIPGEALCVCARVCLYRNVQVHLCKEGRSQIQPCHLIYLESVPFILLFLRAQTTNLVRSDLLGQLPEKGSEPRTIAKPD